MPPTILPRQTDLPLLVKQPGHFVHRYRWPLLLLLIGATADVVTTVINVRRYGAGTEVHPAQYVILQIFGGTLGVPIAKAIQLAFVLGVAAWWRPWCRYVLLVCAALYGVAALSNHFLWF